METVVIIRMLMCSHKWILVLQQSDSQSLENRLNLNPLSLNFTSKGGLRLVYALRASVFAIASTRQAGFPTETFNGLHFNS